MNKSFSRWLPQPHLVVIASVAVLGLLWILWLGIDPSMQGLRLPAFLLALLLAVAVVIADAQPIQLGPHFKVSVTTIPLFMMAALLPPPLAGLTAGASVLVAEVQSRTKRLKLPAEIAATAGRWALVVFLSSTLITLPVLNQVLYPFQLVAAAAVMFLSDVLSSALELKLMSKEPFWRVTVLIARESALVETVQYALGIIGAVAAREHTWLAFLLALPAFVVYLAFRSIKETRPIMERMVHVLNSQQSGKHGSLSQAALAQATLLDPAPKDEPDYYATLQITPNSEPEAIDSAYRQLVHLYHPDLNPGADAAGRMRSIDEAYEVLGDPVKRTQYDRLRQLVRAGLSRNGDTDPDARFAFIAQVLEYELRQGCGDDTLISGLEVYAQNWASQLADEAPELRIRAASVAAFLQGYAEKAQVERAQAILQALARARNQPVPFFKVGQFPAPAEASKNVRRSDPPVESSKQNSRPALLQRIAFEDLSWNPYSAFAGITILLGLLLVAFLLLPILMSHLPW